MNSQAVSAKLSDDNRLQAPSLMSKNGEQSIPRCDNLVLAAGPWTPVAFKTLFPQAPVNIEAVMDAGDWIVFENIERRSAKSIAAVYFNKTVGKMLYLPATLTRKCGQRARKAGSASYGWRRPWTQ